MCRCARLFSRFGSMTGILVLILLGCSREKQAAPESTPSSAAPPPQATMEGAALRQVERWGPQSTPAGTPFNRLASGDSAIWIVSTGEPQVVVELAGRALPTTVRDDVVTAAVPHQLVESLLARPGEFVVELTSPVSGRRQRVGVFQVKE
jgi:hypothetical protein